MAKGMYHYIRQAWKKPTREMLKSRTIEWRRGGVIEILEHPTRIDRARWLGYKAKPGFLIARVKLLRGGRTRRRPSRKGRRSKRQGIRKVLSMSYQWVAESRAGKKFPGLEVLNSYFLAKDGMNYYYEVILVDKNRPEIQSDKSIKWICSAKNRNRVFRGLTSAAKKSRGLR